MALAVLSRVCLPIHFIPNLFPVISDQIDVPDIRNPISLAKLILDLSNKPLSLRRVPPNALVGQGAKNFAEEHGMATFGNEYLVSKNARDRFIRWQDDLKRAEGKAKESKPSANSEHGQAECSPCQYDTGPPLEAHRTYSRDHSAAVIAGPWNEGQPDSPYYGTPTPGSVAGSESPITANYFRSPVASVGVSTARSGRNGLSPSRSRGRSRRADLTTQAATSRSNALTPDEINQTYADAVLGFDTRRPKQANGYQTGLPFTERLANDFPQGVKRPNSQTDEGGVLDRHPTWRPFRHGADGEDQITDTIGAIAIDDKGHIAAGSSSGGIGMKHQGRLGPAALVGIGTAVVPFSEDDEEGITVAAVTSGTGEHMATTMASQRCAERIYRGVRKGVGGGEVQDDDEDAIMESFIADDFMNHPGVRNCHSAGAIGVMVVKKTRTGYYLYFAHNTDSFALASMGGTEKEPVCTMSRLSEGAEIARGGRKIRVD